MREYKNDLRQLASLFDLECIPHLNLVNVYLFLISSNKGNRVIILISNILLKTMKNIIYKNVFYLVVQKEILRKMRESNINSTFACLKTDCDNEQMPPGRRKECELQNI